MSLCVLAEAILVIGFSLSLAIWFLWDAVRPIIEWFSSRKEGK